MSLQHFFLENQIIDTELENSEDGIFSLNLCSEDIKHARALRLSSGEHIGAIDANNIYYECEICDFNNKKMYVKVTKHDSVEPINNNIEITLCFGVLKGSKADEVIRGCTEIGIDRFIPVDFERCVSRPDSKSENNKIDRWQKIAKSASMQSGQYRFPEICEFKNVNQLIDELKNFDLSIVFWEESDDNLSEAISSISCHSDTHCRVAIIIGPEGGISEDEIQKLSKSIQNCHVVTMGRSILRSQTACVVGCGLVNHLLREK